MIPPLQDLRLRSIKRWLKDSRPAPSSPQALDNRAREIDEQMIEAFSDREDAVKWAMMKNKTWGTGEGMESFPLARLEIWQDVVSEFLPPIFEPDQET